MPIKGGISIDGGEVSITLSINGGRKYKRVYTDAAKSAVDKFKTMAELIINSKHKDTKIYVNQLKSLFQYAHVELLEGDNTFQVNYNLWLLNGYVKMLLQSLDIKLISQLLNLDGILYSVEEAGVFDGEYIDTDFKLPKMSNINKNGIKISMPTHGSVDAMILSLDKNIITLIKFMEKNTDTLKRVYDEIVKQASKQLCK